jgi:hypothetical protein
MKKRIVYLVSILNIVLFTQNVSSSAQDRIKLYSDLDSFYTIYETKLAILYLNNSDIIRFLSQQIQLTEICPRKKENYSALLGFYTANERKIIYIIIPTKDASLEDDLPSTRKTGFAPLDFFAGLVWLDLSRPYIPPHGYKPAFIDSADYFKLDTLNKSVVNELVLKGEGRVFNKQANSYEDSIFLEILDFNDGHGGRNLLFSNKELFYNIDWYGDVGGKFDPECL